MSRFPNIVSNPEIMGGKPCIKDTRISVALIMEWLASGADIAGITTKHPLLTVESVKEAIKYAGHFADHEIIIEVQVA